MLGIPVGLATVNASEWLIHKYVLHGWGRNRKSFWSMHWDHHKKVRLNNFDDSDYRLPPWGDHPHAKEARVLAASALAVSPLFPVAPFFTATLWYGAWNYYRVHKRAHLDPEWARAHVPWHYAHHMGENQNMNWCVTRPWFDKIMGTSRY